MSKIINGRIFYDVGEVAEILGVTKVTAYNFIRRGVLEAVRTDRTRVQKEKLEEYLKMNIDDERPVVIREDDIPEDIEI